ncbi:hypothetical protein AURDEDRAFT_185047 [Auricularia subglabra TFB-10046 SS5]|nr:hypothetical protein AURDEDRAFT_185047 [Auricularia subglabra TFB-10046 SS5]
MVEVQRPPLQPGAGLLELCSRVPTVLDLECARIQDYTGLAVACAFEAAVALLRTELERAIVAHAERRNVTQPPAVARLAPELLCSVFTHLTLADRISASHVCQSWRSTALASTALWADIASHNQPAGILTQRVTRVPDDILLNLSVYVNQETYSEVACVLASHLGRLRQLWIRISDKLGDDQRRALREALSHPAPNLWQLRVLDGKRNLLTDSSTPIFAGTAPLLKLVKFYGHSQLLAGLPGSIERILFSESGATSLETIRSSMEHFNSASGFAVEIDEWTNSDSAVLTVPETVQTLLLVSNDDDVDMADVVRHINHAPVRTFGIAFRSRAAMSEDDTAALFQSMLAAVDERVAWVQVLQSFHKTGRVQLDVRHADGRHRSVLKCQLAWAARLAAAPFAGVRHLRFGETLLFAGAGAGPYDLPRVERLDIILVSPDRQGERGADSVFLLARKPGAWLSCPGLRELAFFGGDTGLALPVAADKGRAGAAPTTLAPEMLREFLTWHLDCPHGYTLALRGVGLYTGNAAEVALLLRLVQDITITEPEDVQECFSVVPEFYYLTSWDYDERFPYHD